MIRHKEKKFQLSAILTIAFIHLLHDTYSCFLPPLLPLLREKLTLSYSSLSFLSVIQRLPSLLFPMIGLLADKIDFRYLLIVTPIITACVMSFLGIVPHYGLLVLLLLIMGLSASFFHVPGPIMIKKVSGNRIGMGMGFYMLGGEIARAVGPLLILGAVSLWGLEGTWKLVPVALAASLTLSFKLRHIVAQGEKKNVRSVLSRPIKLLRNYSQIFILLIGYQFFTSTIKSTLTFYLPTYLNNQGNSLLVGGLALSVFQLAGALGTLLAGTLSDRIGRRRTLLTSSIISPVLMIGLIHSKNHFMAFSALIGLGIFLFTSMPVLLAYVNDIETDRPAFLNSIYMTIGFVIGPLVLMILGAISDQIGLESTIRYTPFMGVCAIPFVFLLPNSSGRVQGGMEI